MIIDDTLVLSENQAIAAAAGSTNVIDLGAIGTAFGHAAPLARDVGKGGRVPISIAVTEAFAGLTTLTIALQVDDNAAFSSPKTVASSGAIPVAALVAGYRPSFPDHVPEGADERYMRLFYTPAGTATAGRITAAVSGGRQSG